ncbi:MAG: DAK2 domain-containing protein [Oscillospiraceae bacterium]|nr:DAK2 domain-containing protein [Oscillospiraceae bacterium]
MINGQIFKDSIISAANNISNQKKFVNSLNVFPIPDGDTGFNIAKTMNAAKTVLVSLHNDVNVCDVIKVTASSLLRGARGNSGAIISLIFRGFNKALEKKKMATALDFSKALKCAADIAYGAVSKPTEGTMLTVIRLVANESEKFAKESNNFQEFWAKVCEKAQEVLETTPDLLPILAESGVVDSGAQGLVIIFEGMKSVFENTEIIKLTQEETISEKVTISSVQNENAFCYCTEFLVEKLKKDLNTKQLEEYLNKLGDSVILVDDNNVIKVHVHTNHPGLILEKALELGPLNSIKIDNESAAVKKTTNTEKNQFVYKTVDENINYGFVAVASGPGICDLFQSLGVNNIVQGGQTMNPSTEEILQAIEATPSKTVFVLPNNKNVIMTAEQTINLADRAVIVLPSRTVPHGIAALLSFDESIETKKNQLVMLEAIEKVKTGLITNAVKNSKIAGNEIKAGDVIAIENGKIKFVAEDYLKACLKLIKSMVKKHNNYITIFCGQNIDKATAENLENQVKTKHNNFEINIINGGQPIYPFIISIE